MFVQGQAGEKKKVEFLLGGRFKGALCGQFKIKMCFSLVD